MIQYVLKKNVNEKMPNAYGKYFAYPVITVLTAIISSFCVSSCKG